MISFKIFTPEEKEDRLAELLSAHPSADSAMLREIFSVIEEEYDAGCEPATAASAGCLLIRLFDGEYKFPYPIALTDTAKPKTAINEIRLYSVKEEIPLVFCDVPSDCLSGLVTSFRHLNIDAEDAERAYYTVRAMGEAAMICDIPSAECDGISLAAIDDLDTRDYERLCRDEETNRFWGYDYREDISDAPVGYFIDAAREEFERGTAISFAVRENGKFVGEAILYAFDLIGGCECAIRLLPDARGKGIASRALALLERVADGIGIIRLYATVDEKNEPSKKLFENHFNFTVQGGEKLKFYKYLQI